MPLLRRHLPLLIGLCATAALGAQESVQRDTLFRERLLVGRNVQIDGQELAMMVTDAGDTILVASSLADVSVSSPRAFDNADDYKLYRKYRYYAGKVYPYAVEAIRIFRETEEVTETMGDRARKRHYKRLQKELKKEFEDPLKKLTKTQGYILVKMIEKETGEPMHDLIKELRGGLTATYWTTMGKFFGHQLNEGYTVGDDRILDIVLRDYDVSHHVADSLQSGR